MILTLGRFMITIARSSPGQGSRAAVRTGPDQVPARPGHALAIAADATAVLALADWARSGADAWLWSLSGSLLGGLQHDAVHALGAALHRA